jgi:hypothetical protein
MLCVQLNPSGHRTNIYTPINFLKAELRVHQAWFLSQYPPTSIFTLQRHHIPVKGQENVHVTNNQQLPGTKHHVFIEIHTLLHVPAIV